MSFFSYVLQWVFDLIWDFRRLVMVGYEFWGWWWISGGSGLWIYGGGGLGGEATVVERERDE